MGIWNRERSEFFLFFVAISWHRPGQTLYPPHCFLSGTLDLMAMRYLVFTFWCINCLKAGGKHLAVNVYICLDERMDGFCKTLVKIQWHPSGNGVTFPENNRPPQGTSPSSHTPSLTAHPNNNLLTYTLSSPLHGWEHWKSLSVSWSSKAGFCGTHTLPHLITYLGWGRTLSRSLSLGVMLQLWMQASLLGCLALALGKELTGSFK